MIKNFNDFLNEQKSNDIDPNHEYGVFMTGGSIGSNKNGLEKRFGSETGKLVKTFEDELTAKEWAKRMNSGVSKGEKQYYGISYKFSKLSKSDKNTLIGESKKVYGLMIIGRTQQDNNKISDVLDDLELYGEWDKEGFWFVEEEVENYDSLERLLDKAFAKARINASFEGIF